MYIFVNLVEVTFLSHDSSEKSHPRCIDNPKLYGKPQNEKKKCYVLWVEKGLKQLKVSNLPSLMQNFVKLEHRIHPCWEGYNFE